MAPPDYILGTGHFGATWSKAGATDLVQRLKDFNINRIDSAALYPVTDAGASERILGDAKYAEHGFVIDTKILFPGYGSSDGTMSEEAIQKSVANSFQSLGVQNVNVLYCHFPDMKTPIREQAATVDRLFKKSAIKQFGVCNFSANMLEDWLQVAEEEGYIKPSVFQGQYNLFCRGYEQLFPLLRKHAISFVAFSPLAGGFLTGKLTFATGADKLSGTRFGEGNVSGMYYKSLYDHEAMHEAMRKMAKACESHGIGIADAATRWILEHCSLDAEKGDSVIIGPSNVQQLEEYMASRNRGSLPDDLVRELDGLWEMVKDDASRIVSF